MTGGISKFDFDELIHPNVLEAGDSVAIFSPSFSGASNFPARFRRAVNNLSHLLDVKIIIDQQNYKSTGFTAGSAKERAVTLMNLFENESVKAIFTTIGGYNSNEILSYLDCQIIRENPKIIIGYSDTTALLLGIQSIGNLITFYGPAVLSQFGEYPQPYGYTIEWLIKCIMQDDQLGEIVDPPYYTAEYAAWGQPEKLTSRRIHTNPGRSVWNQGEGEGFLFGGNIQTISYLIGTKFIAIPDNVVFFWEATHEISNLPKLRRALFHLEQIGLFEKTSAMLIGKYGWAENKMNENLDKLISEVTFNYDFPIIGDLPFGHTDPMITLPIGVKVKVTADSVNETMIEISKSGVKR